MPLSPSEQLAYSTVRVECVYKSGSTGTGTGFFFNFLFDNETGLGVPVIITNKHVINDAISGKLTLSLRGNDDEPIDKEHYTFNLDRFEQRWLKHPDPSVDLCMMSFSPFVSEAQAAGKKLAYICLNTSILPGNIERDGELDATEEVLMIGYPNGIWDTVNNKPILRRGLTATHPSKDYLGKKEFVIDAACFPGSSGSPVFLYNIGTSPRKHGGAVLGNRIVLLGVLYAGPQMTVRGEIVVVDIPTIQSAVAVSQTMINLGYVIKSERILELEKLFELSKH